jgi:hypothetical protein
VNTETPPGQSRQGAFSHERFDDPIRTKTTGWQPGCSHGLDPVPCTVCDPFAGSGTTGAVALELGRKAVLIELNPKYVELI